MPRMDAQLRIDARAVTLLGARRESLAILLVLVIRMRRCVIRIRCCVGVR